MKRKFIKSLGLLFYVISSQKVKQKDILEGAQYLFNVPEKRDSYMKYYETMGV